MKKRMWLIILCIVCLPLGLLIWSALKVTDEECRMFPFSMSLHTRSRAIALSVALYAGLYYWLYQTIVA